VEVGAPYAAEELDCLLAERAEEEMAARRTAAKEAEECAGVRRTNEQLERNIDAKDAEFAKLEVGPYKSNPVDPQLESAA
jgi:hypothetical protein